MKTNFEKPTAAKEPATRKPIERKPLSDFKRDTKEEKTLLRGGWAKKGGTSMSVAAMAAGKSTLATQSVLCFNRGISCCGLTPTHPFNMWVIQNEDDEDRVALDRDCIVEKLSALHPDQDWNTAIKETVFLDFTGLTGVKFIEALNEELKTNPPDGVLIHPFNKFHGCDIMSHRDMSAFFGGGTLERRETEGIEAVFRRHNVWGWFFGHTPQPPTDPKKYREWLNDPHAAYRACGVSEIADAMRSMMTFLRIPGTNTFAFLACKNGEGLGWTGGDGKPTTRAFFKWSDDGKHFWCDVPKNQWEEIENSISNVKREKSSLPKTPPRDDMPAALEAFARLTEPIGKTAARDMIKTLVNNARANEGYPAQMTRKEAEVLRDTMKAQGLIDCFGSKNNMQYGLPEMINKLRSEKIKKAK